MATSITIHWARFVGLLSQDTGKPTREEPGDPVVDPRFEDLAPEERYCHRDDILGRDVIQEMNERLASRGVQHFDAFEVLHLPKHRIPGMVAVPPLSAMRSLVRAACQADILRARCGFALAARGYRPPAYNRAVGGAKRSRHLHGQAVDLRVVVRSLPDGLLDSRRSKLAWEAARMWVEDSAQLKMGLGVYSFGNGDVSHVHVDFGHRARLWADGYAWVQKVRRSMEGVA